MKNTLIEQNTKSNNMKNLKKNLKIIDVLKSIDDTNSKRVLNKIDKKQKFFSEIFPSKNKDSQSIKMNRVNLNAKITNINKETISNNLNNTLINKNKETNINPKRFIKSQIFLESFKNLQLKNKLKSSLPLSQVNNIQLNSNTLEKFSLDTGNVVSSTKSNSFASSYSNSNTLSNSLKYINLKAQISNNTESTMSNSSFTHSKDLKTKYRNFNLDKVKTSSACNVEISLNTNKMRNKKFVSSNGNESKKNIMLEKRKLSVNKSLIKK